MSIEALGAATTGLKVMLDKIKTISNNVANSETIGYKRFINITSDLGYVSDTAAGTRTSEDAQNASGRYYGLGAKTLTTVRNVIQGTPFPTNQPLDIAIGGAGYFAIALPNGRVGYTRAGSFTRNQDTGAITTHTGYPLLDNINLPLEIDMDTLNISNSGFITASDPNDNNITLEIGQLTVYRFPNDRALVPIGENLMEASSASGEAVQIENLSQKFWQRNLESSTVNAVEELTDLISAQRHYELGTKVIKAADEAAKETNNMK